LRIFNFEWSNGQSFFHVTTIGRFLFKFENDGKSAQLIKGLDKIISAAKIISRTASANMNKLQVTILLLFHNLSNK
jgi:hypothetical protein